MKPAKEDVKEIQSPSGLDLYPPPPSSVRLSKRAGVLAFALVFAVVAAVGYGVVTRSGRSIDTGFQPAEAKLTAATDAGKVIAAQIPTSARVTAGVTDRAPAQQDELRPPGQTPSRSSSDVAGQRTYSGAPYSPSTVVPQPQYREPTPEEKRIAAAYERELQALDSPTNPQGTTGVGLGRLAVANTSASDGGNSQLGNLLRS